jgi:hypothetical protein
MANPIGEFSALVSNNIDGFIFDKFNEAELSVARLVSRSFTEMAEPVLCKRLPLKVL